MTLSEAAEENIHKGWGDITPTEVQEADSTLREEIASMFTEEGEHFENKLDRIETLIALKVQEAEVNAVAVFALKLAEQYPEGKAKDKFLNMINEEYGSTLAALHKTKGEV